MTDEQEQEVQRIYRESRKAFKELGEKSVVGVITFPNGYEVAVSAHAHHREDHSYAEGRKVCEEQMMEAVADYVILRSHDRR